jgi:two-component system, cell cycle response regulator CtrA
MMSSVERSQERISGPVSMDHPSSVVQTDDLVVNTHTNAVTVEGARVHLTGKEYEILRLLSVRKGETISKEMLLNHLYSGIDEPNMRIIDVFVCKLRKKLSNASGGKNYIQTIWGRGYLMRDIEETEARICA